MVFFYYKQIHLYLYLHFYLLIFIIISIFLLISIWHYFMKYLNKGISRSTTYPNNIPNKFCSFQILSISQTSNSFNLIWKILHKWYCYFNISEVKALKKGFWGQLFMTFRIYGIPFHYMWSEKVCFETK